MNAEEDGEVVQAFPDGKPRTFSITCPRCGRQFQMKVTPFGVEYCGCGHLKDVVMNGVVTGVFRKV